MATDRENQLLQAAHNAGINSPRELANFMAQVGHESGGLNRLNEGFRYTRSAEQVSSKVQSAMREGRGELEEARLDALRGQPERLAELMYGNRRDLGNSEPGDGYRFHGRGYIQLTGRNQYREAGEALGVDLVRHPELAANPENAARIAVWYWQHKVPESTQENVRAAGAAINGANPPNGLADREQQFQKWERTLTPALMHTLAEGRLGQSNSSPPAAAQVTPATTPPAIARRDTDPGAALLNETRQHFFNSGRQYEYGRSDTTLRPGNDRSRFERDSDGDGRLGVDCSAFVWRGLKNAGFNVPGETAANFTTSTLFNGRQLTSFATENFNGISAAEARRPNGNLHPGDLLLFKSKSGSGQHVGIFEGYDAQGNIRFIGSQVSTGPASVTVRPGGYWDGEKLEIVGALRPKAEFQTRTPVSGTQAPTIDGATPSPRTGHTTDNNGLIREGSRGQQVTELQEKLNRAGITDANGAPLRADGSFGPATRGAVEAFQRREGLHVDGIVGPRTEAGLARTPSNHQSAAPIGPAHPDHRNHELFNALQQKLPPGTSVEHLTHATAMAHSNGITGTDKLQAVVMQGNVAHIAGATPGFRASVDLSQPAPSLEKSMAQLDQHQEQARQQQPKQALG